ncbi:MAG TPA: ADOP family duplicated permease [Gemmatimonadaceae bacterium]
MSAGDMLMDVVSDLRFRWRALIHRAEVERELDEELRFHLEREATKLEQRGLDAQEARRRARLEFGGVDRVKEETRDARGVRVLETIVRDVRYAVRGLRARPGFALAVIVTLALGIGANAAMFGIVDRLMFRSLPYLRDPASVNRAYLSYSFRGARIVGGSLEYPRYLDLATSPTLSQSAAFRDLDLAIGTGQDSHEMHVDAVSASFFEFFDARPAIGRFFDTSEESTLADAPVVVLGYAFWKTRFGGRADVLGQQLQVGSISATIVGVAPKGFVGSDEVQPAGAFIPLTAYGKSQIPSFDKDYSWGWLAMMIRRKPGISTSAVAADLSRLYALSWQKEQALESRTAPVSLAKPTALVAPLHEMRGPDAGRNAPIILWICGVAAIVLLIACANVANLLLSRAFRRKREIAVRLALGATRGRLMTLLLIESLMLALAAGIAGMIVGEGGQLVLSRLFLPRNATIGVLDDARTIIFACLAALMAGLLTGMAPALQAGREDLVSALKSGAREGVRHRSRTRSALLVAQGTLSVFLLVGAGLFVRSLHKVAGIKLGYDVDKVMYVAAEMRGLALEKEQDIVLKTKLMEEARSIPGVEHVSQALTIPLWQMRRQSFSVPGVDSADHLGQFLLQMGTADFFRTMGTRIVRGRGFDSTDRRGSPPIIVVSQGMAQKIWPGEDALGKCVRVGGDTMPCATVIGVAENIKASDVIDDSGLQYYLSIDQQRPAGAALLVRTRGDAAGLEEVVRKRLQPLMPGPSYVTVTPMREIVDPARESWRLGATMFLLFGLLALVLAAIGLYSVIAYNVAQRTHELGLRIALGAHARDVLRMVLAEGLRFGLAGIGIGVAIALAAGHWVQPLLYQESAQDPLVFLSVAAVLAIVAVAASAIPASRAIRVDPSIALRAE